MSTTVTTTRQATSTGRHGHRCAQGFCTVCGSVWPCWRALADETRAGSAPATTPAWGLPRC